MSDFNRILNASLQDIDPHAYEIGREEARRQEDHLEMIASENFTSLAVMEAMATKLTNKYAEGYPGKRYYSGCESVDKAEILAIDRAKKLFGAAYVNVQPHSGAQANMAVYFAVLKPGDTILAMNLAHGGHLTHGSPVNFSGQLYNIVPYGVKKDDQRIDYDEVERLAQLHRPKLIVCGASAYPRQIDFERFAHIARSVDALLLADIAHISGLVAAGVHPSPIPHCDFVTSTTQKTLRGPRGGLIMAKAAFEKVLNSAVFPGMQGSPMMHVILAKAVAFGQALEPEFKVYMRQVVANAQALAQALKEEGFNLLTGGTDNHLVLIDLQNKAVTGKAAELALEKAGIACNKNMIPFDPQKPFVTSGIRLGTPALTTRGMKETEMGQIARLVSQVLAAPDDQAVREAALASVKKLCQAFPLYA